jgi:hypothetical protein
LFPTRLTRTGRNSRGAACSKVFNVIGTIRETVEEIFLADTFSLTVSPLYLRLKKSSDFY